MDIDGIEVTVTRKRIRNLYLRIKPPSGTVEVSAPMRMAEYRIRDFVRERRDWIIEQRERIAQSRRLVVEEMAARGGAVDVPLEGLDDAAFAGLDGANGGKTMGGADGLNDSRGSDGTADAGSGDNGGSGSPDLARAFVWTDERRREAASSIESQLPALLDKWAPIVGKRPTHVTLRLMTSRWGSCTPKTGRIRINLQLGLMEPRFLEYVLVHELTHLWEHGHGPRFRARMDAYLPGWRALRRELNRRAVL
nr:SprT family zinc-dependent metalloprotease [Bifidobacterium parmae]